MCNTKISLREMTNIDDWNSVNNWYIIKILIVLSVFQTAWNLLLSAAIKTSISRV